MCPVSSGLIGPTSSEMLLGPPCSVTVCDCCVWFEIRRSIGPAPNFAGSTETALSVITPDRCSGTGGRRLFLKSLPPPHPAPPRIDRATVRSSAARGHPTLVFLPHIPPQNPIRL